MALIRRWLKALLPFALVLPASIPACHAQISSNARTLQHMPPCSATIMTNCIPVASATGSIGIASATATPLAPLQIGSSLGSVTNTPDVFIGGHVGGATPIYRIRTGAYDNNAGYGFYLKTHFSVNSLATFGTRDGAVDIDTLTIKAGNVGINTLTPHSKLAVVGLVVYANNAAAISGGLAAGDFYRTGGDPDTVAVVH